MPGCYLLSSADVTGPFAVTNPQAVVSLGTIPNNTALVGGSIFAQAVTVTPGINATSVVSTNGGELVIGNY